MKVLVTAALPYANGPLHLGHIRSTYLPADICARYYRLRGCDVIYVCATDEHGTPIVVAAEKAKKTPQEFAQYYHEKDEREFRQLGFSMDIFHRTSSEENKAMTIHFFTKLMEHGHIYQKEVEQFYCEKCGRFLPDRFIVGTCPSCRAEGQYGDACEQCGKALKGFDIIDGRCALCGARPIKKITNHYFFKLSSFAPFLKTYLTTNKELQKEVVNYVLNWIEQGLADWDITRNLSWGIPVPNEKDLVFYVWFDAPIGYVSSTQALVLDKFDEWWKNPDTKIIHFIGKDIVYHHFLFWPAMLMGTEDGFTLPSAIPVRGYLNLEHRKFSKSKRWFVSLEDYLAHFEPDYLRYYVTTITPHAPEDADFLWKEFQKRVNDELVANIGNLFHRTLVLIKKNGGALDATCVRAHPLYERIEKVKKEVEVLMETYEYKAALEKIVNFASEVNKYLSDEEPWKITDKKKYEEILCVAFRGVSAIAIMLYPFIPFSMETFFRLMKADVTTISWELIGLPLVSRVKLSGDVKPLFRKIEDKEIERELAKLGT